MKSLFLIVLFINILNSGYSQILNSDSLYTDHINHTFSNNYKKDSLKFYMANVFKIDKSIRDQGVLWSIGNDQILLVPKDQFIKWKNSKLSVNEINFTKINNDNLRLLKIYSKKEIAKSILIRTGIGLAIGTTIGLIRKNNYDASYCEGGNDPLWTRCIGGRNRLAYNIGFWGATGFLVGLLTGSKIKIPINQNTFENQKAKIQKYTLLSN